MDTPFIGMIALFGFNFAPKGWAFCNGQLLSIAQNTALFALLGTAYGGDGKTTFALPDLQGRIPVGQGTGPGLSAHTIGERGGAETTTLTIAHMPVHSHPVIASGAQGTTSDPKNAYLANSGDFDTEFATTPANAVSMNPAMIGASGGSQPLSVLQPYLVLNYCISLTGIFPSRD